MKNLILNAVHVSKYEHPDACTTYTYLEAMGSESCTLMYTHRICKSIYTYIWSEYHGKFDELSMRDAILHPTSKLPYKTQYLLDRQIMPSDATLYN